MAHVPLSDLWIPIAFAAVVVFVASSIMHMVLKYHRSDYRQLQNEAELVGVLGKAKPAPGTYHFPYCAEMKDMKSPEMQEKLKGPVGLLVMTGAPNMGKLLGLWFVYCLLVSLFCAYLAGRTLTAGADYLIVFRVVGTAAFMAYGLSQMVDSIWKGQIWSNTFKHIVDGLVYALLTAGVFGWLWP